MAQGIRKGDVLVEVNGKQTRDAVFNELVEKLFEKASEAHA